MEKEFFQNTRQELSYETIPIEDEMELVRKEDTTVSGEALKIMKREPVFYGNKIVSAISKLFS